MIPKDPVILLSYVNTQLRDHFDSLDEFCKSFDISKEDIVGKLSGIGYQYDLEGNCFKTAKLPGVD